MVRIVLLRRQLMRKKKEKMGDSWEVCACCVAVDPPTSNSKHTWASFKIPLLMSSCAFCTWRCCQTNWHVDTQTHTGIICAPVELLPVPCNQFSPDLLLCVNSCAIIIHLFVSKSVTLITSLPAYLIFLEFSQHCWKMTWWPRCSDTGPLPFYIFKLVAIFLCKMWIRVFSLKAPVTHLR